MWINEEQNRGKYKNERCDGSKLEPKELKENNINFGAKRKND